MGLGSRNETYRGKIDELGKMVNIVEEVLKKISDLEENNIRKRCNFHNRGFCKKSKKCNFEHPGEICDLLEDGDGDVKCKNKECGKRHPYHCKWNQSPGGCRRGVSCAFKHKKEGFAAKDKAAKEVLKNGKCIDLAEEVKAKATNGEKSDAEPIDIILKRLKMEIFLLKRLIVS